MSPAAAGAQGHTPARPQRIVSTNMCTDQILLRLVEPERIQSFVWLSWDGDATPPEYRPVLDHIKKNHGLAEEVLMMQPDLVVGGTFSARFSNSLMAKLGKNVVLFDAENNFDDWYANIRKMGQAVGEPARAEAMIVDFKTKLAALEAEIPPGPMPIYASLSPNNWMPGKDTFYTQVINAGGFRTAGEALGYSGYRAIPLEQLIQIDVALISTNTKPGQPASMARASLTHPLLRMMADRALARVEISDRDVVCPTPGVLAMIRELVDARKQVDRLRAQRGASGAIISK